MSPIRVLIVDDSPVVRMSYRILLQENPGFEIVGEAADPYEARELLLTHRPQVMTLDIEMPRMDGISFLKKLMQYQPLPVVIISSIAGKGSAIAMEALNIGAADVLDKPMTAAARQRFGPALVASLKAAVEVRPLRRVSGPAVSYAGATGVSCIAIGSSTGGPAELFNLLPRLPKTLPPVVIVQHMPEGFTNAFADRLARISGHDVKEASGSELLTTGMFRVAPGGQHLVMAARHDGLRAVPTDGPMIQYHRPSVNLFFQSVARSCGAKAVGVILTGMGEDGAQGLLAMRHAGATTLGQDEASSVVYGMPKAAWTIGAVMRQKSSADLPVAIVDAVKGKGQ